MGSSCSRAAVRDERETHESRIHNQQDRTPSSKQKYVAAFDEEGSDGGHHRQNFDVESEEHLHMTCGVTATDESNSNEDKVAVTTVGGVAINNDHQQQQPTTTTSSSATTNTKSSSGDRHEPSTAHPIGDYNSQQLNGATAAEAEKNTSHQHNKTPTSSTAAIQQPPSNEHTQADHPNEDNVHTAEEERKQKFTPVSGATTIVGELSEYFASIATTISPITGECVYCLVSDEGFEVVPPACINYGFVDHLQRFRRHQRQMDGDHTSGSLIEVDHKSPVSAAGAATGRASRSNNTQGSFSQPSHTASSLSAGAISGQSAGDNVANPAWTAIPVSSGSNPNYATSSSGHLTDALPHQRAARRSIVSLGSALRSANNSKPGSRAGTPKNRRSPSVFVVPSSVQPPPAAATSHSEEGQEPTAAANENSCGAPSPLFSSFNSDQLAQQGVGVGAMDSTNSQQQVSPVPLIAFVMPEGETSSDDDDDENGVHAQHGGVLMSVSTSHGGGSDSVFCGGAATSKDGAGELSSSNTSTHNRLSPAQRTISGGLRTPKHLSPGASTNSHHLGVTYGVAHRRQTMESFLYEVNDQELERSTTASLRSGGPAGGGSFYFNASSRDATPSQQHEGGAPMSLQAPAVFTVHRPRILMTTNEHNPPHCQAPQPTNRVSSTGSTSPRSFSPTNVLGRPPQSVHSHGSSGGAASSVKSPRLVVSPPGSSVETPSSRNVATSFGSGSQQQANNNDGCGRGVDESLTVGSLASPLLGTGGPPPPPASEGRGGGGGPEEPVSFATQEEPCEELTHCGGSGGEITALISVVNVNNELPKPSPTATTAPHSETNVAEEVPTFSVGENSTSPDHNHATPSPKVERQKPNLTISLPQEHQQQGRLHHHHSEEEEGDTTNTTTTPNEHHHQMVPIGASMQSASVSGESYAVAGGSMQHNEMYCSTSNGEGMSMSTRL